MEQAEKGEEEEEREKEREAPASSSFVGSLDDRCRIPRWITGGIVIKI